MKPKYLTLPFWVALLSAASLIAVTLGLLEQSVADTWVQMLTGLVAAILPIAALILGYSEARAQMVGLGLLAEDAPPWLTAEFWLTLVGTGAMVLVAARVITQEQADVWKGLLAPAVAAALAIAAYVRGRVVVQTARTTLGLR